MWIYKMNTNWLYNTSVVKGFYAYHESHISNNTIIYITGFDHFRPYKVYSDKSHSRPYTHTQTGDMYMQIMHGRINDVVDGGFIISNI